MKQIGPDGDLIFSSTEFGSGSVSKTEQIANILKELLTDVTITTESKDVELILSEYYKSATIDLMLTEYVKNVQLASEVADQLNTLTNSEEFRSKFASKSDLDALNTIVTGYSNTIDTILGNQQSLQSQFTQLEKHTDDKLADQTRLIDNLNQNYLTLSSSLATVQSTLNSLNLLDLANLDQRITQLRQDINSARSDIGELDSLETTTKSNLVAAINELVQKQGPINQLKTSDKSSLVAAINELFQSASEAKSLIAAAITGMGVNAAASDSWLDLANKISQITTGYDTSDANITPADIIAGKIAYGSTGRLVGEHTCTEAPNPAE